MNTTCTTKSEPMTLETLKEAIKTLEDGNTIKIFQELIESIEKYKIKKLLIAHSQYTNKGEAILIINKS